MVQRTQTGFQGFVNNQPAPAVLGDWAGSNPRMSAVAPGGAAYRLADAEVVHVGYFAWADPSDGLVYGAEQAASILGFVHRENQTIITEYLGKSRDTLQEGFAVTLITKGDVYAAFPEGAAVGDPVYADATTGEPTTDDDGGANPDTGFVVKTSVPVDAEFTGSIDVNGVLTVTAVAAGVVEPGLFISGANVPASARAQIVSNKTGTGGTGTYQTTFRKVAASATIDGSAGKLAKISTW